MSKDFLSADLPDPSRHILAAFLVVILVCSALLVIDFFVVKKIAEQTALNNDISILIIARSLLENFVACAICAVLLAFMFKVIVAFIDPRDRVIEISSADITGRLRRNAKNANKYTFIGNTATFVTSTVLPIMVDKAREGGVAHSLSLYIIDPMDVISISSYSIFKSQVSHAKSKIADKEIAKWVQPLYAANKEEMAEVKAKLIAAIYLAAYAHMQSNMSVYIYLRRSFTPFRYDLTDSEVVLTQESASESAVAFSSRGHFYGWYNKEAKAQEAQSVRIDLQGENSNLHALNLVHPSAPLPKIIVSINNLVSLFPYLKPLSLDVDVIELAATKVSKPSHAYNYRSFN